MESTYGNGSGKDVSANAQEEEEGDDYMSMTFEEPKPMKESSIQRTKRLKEESRARGLIKSKAELAEEEAAAREKALSTSMLDDPRAKKSKGLAMMAKMGFSGGGLGKQSQDNSGGTTARTEPIKVDIKEDRGGIGMDTEKKRKLREAAEERSVKTAKLDPDEYRERVRREREEGKMEKQFFAVQRMAEQLDNEKEPDEVPIASRPLKAISVLYRSLIRHRAEKERDRRMRSDLEQSLSRLPTYEDEEEDRDDKKAFGKDEVVYDHIQDLEEEDAELGEFNELDIRERLQRALGYLRERHWYCFWCKAAYPDAEMDGCPGVSEEAHD